MSIGRTFNRGCDAIEHGLKKTSNVAAYIVNNKEPFDKLLKTVLPIFEVIGKFFSETVVGGIVKLFKNVKDLTGALNIFDRVDEWANPSRRKRVTKQLPKSLSRGFLTVAHGIDTALFLDKVNVINLGCVPVLGYIKNAAVLVSAGFSIWACANDLKSAKKQDEYFSEKLEIWQNLKRTFDNPQTRDETIKSIRINNIEKIHRFTDLNEQWIKLKSNIDADQLDQVEQFVSHKIKALDALIHQQVTSKIAKKKRTLQFWKNISKVVNKILNSNMSERNKAKVKSELKKVFSAEERDSSLKLRKWTDYNNALDSADETERLIKYKIDGKWKKSIRNNGIKKKCSWIAIAAEIAKIAIVSLVMILMFKDLITLTASFITVAAVGFVSQSLGLVKCLNKKFGQQFSTIRKFRLNPQAA